MNIKKFFQNPWLLGTIWYNNTCKEQVNKNTKKEVIKNDKINQTDIRNKIKGFRLTI